MTPTPAASSGSGASGPSVPPAPGGRAWVGQVRSMFSHMVRIAVKPEWVAILDFEQRFPSAIEAAMSGR